MDIARLASLVLCAALATATGPWLSPEDAPPAREDSLAVDDASPASDADPAEVLEAPQVARADAAPEIVGAIVRRLEVRHTALPERERLALAQTIVREARRHDLEPDLVLAVIEVESAGYHLAVSHVGAMGLMQLLPATGEEVAARLGIDWNGPDTLFDPTKNVQLGTAYLKQLSDRYDGDVGIALAAYNWGPGRIDRRLRSGDTVPSRYIEQVMRAYDRNELPVSRSS
ncbi:MAG: lytic transglycosylase domain-containing protein [Spirochaetaceae bacterium]|nr:lytic transglycosylase domain-containing protein [Myxococcales bacterium]MCB9722904.1 lytic transglycosylase domain-containing protein [Spirochaetaceae bacterium]